MKKILLMAIIATLFAGCASHDIQYAKAKDAYITAKAIADVIPKDQATEEGLDIIDWFAVEYDTLRGVIRGDDDNASN